ncbi:MAG TPA: M28 family peptidase, partial [Planctomycetota bacterium]|nr:M28 family peptidase [Planctomycetota bacterium]
DAWLCDDRPPRRARAGVAVALVGGRATPDGRYAKLSDLPAGDDNPFPVFGLGDVDRDLLAAELDAGRPVRLRFALDATNARAEVESVFARVPARAGAPPGYLLYCAHGDSDAGGPGANDNASGEAIVLEIAEAWAAALSAGAVEPPPRELRFALWGSEIHSSRAHLRRAEAEGAVPLLGVVNYDQSGFGAGQDRLYLEPDDLPANGDLIRCGVAVLGDFGGRPGFPERWATVRSLGGTDSYVFSSSSYFRDAGRPAITLYASAWGEPSVEPRTPTMPGESWRDRDVVEVDHDPWYHSSGDLPEHTTDREPWNLAWGARVGMLAGLRWLEGEGRVTAPPPLPPK